MSWFSRLRNRHAHPQAAQPTLTSLAKELDTLIESASLAVFGKHAAHLLDQALIYLPPAVWGASQDGPLTRQQDEIWREINPIIERIMAQLVQEGQDDRQRFATEYLVRGLFVSKLAFLVEVTRLRVGQPLATQGVRPENDLARLATMGSA